jgi:uncharacterized protein YuzE
MIDFKFDYDLESDDLFVFLNGKKSSGAIELGNFIFDFDEKGDLVAMEILEASKTLSEIMSKVLELNKIKELKIEMTNIRNMVAIRFKIKTDTDDASANILVPKIKEKSPVLIY